MPDQPFVDGHTHVFNVGFLPVEGIMRSRGVPKIIAIAVTHVLERLLERELTEDDASPSAQERQPLIAMLEQELAGHTPAADAITLDAPDLIGRVAQLVPESDLDALRPVLAASAPGISADTRAITSMRRGTPADPAPYDDVRRQLEELLREAARDAGGVESDDAAAFGLTASARGVVDWLLLLVQHESRIVRSFPGAWKPKADFGLTVHHMMDMEPHYPGRPPVYAFATEQLRRMRAVAGAPPVPLVGFVAYGPFRDDWEPIVDGALANGFIGVKFYPPNGYRPIDNTDDDLANGMKGRTVDDRNLQLFRKCAPSVPIFTHCTRGGMESRPGVTGPFSNPKHWRDVLQTEGLSGLRLCLGHAGGQEGWLAPPGSTGDSAWKDSYAHEVVELCATFDNVYCDFGYFDGLLAGHGAAFFQARLEAAVRKHGERFARKCCYGTDWHLMSIQRGAATYPTLFDRLLRSSDVLAPYADDILARNALRFLDLGGFLERSGPTLGDEERRRLEVLGAGVAGLVGDDDAPPAPRGLDTTQNVTGALGKLAGAGYAFVVRYYSHNAWKTVKQPEARAIAKAGLDLVAVWQDANDSAGYFTRERGERDGAAAFAYGKAIGQPAGSAIYFAVDYDASDADVKGRLVDYFAGVRASFVAAGNGDQTYVIGVYGSGAVCAGMLAQGLAARTWLALASGWRGYATFGAWNLRQGDQKQIFGLTADPDRAQGDYGGFRVSAG